MKTLKQILSELREIKKELQSIASKLEQAQIHQPSKVGRLSTEIKLDTEEIVSSIREFLANEERV